MTTVDDLEAIVDSGGTKADRARALFKLGCERTDVVELLGMSYSQAHSLWKGLNADNPSNGRDSHRAVQARRGGSDGEAVAAAQRSYRTARGLNLRPAQTRFITQDRHVVLKSADSGVSCRTCDQPITFSLKYLGFVHTYSKAEPTKLEDNYD